jgi:PKD repeat protein
MRRSLKSARSATATAIVLLGVSASIAQAATLAGVVPDVPTGTPSPHVPPVLGGPNLDYQGGTVMHSNRTHIIFWNPSNASLTWDTGYQSLITGFLTNVAADSHSATNVYGLTGQYGDTTGRAVYDSTYAGALQDSDPVPANGCTPPGTGPGWAICLSDSQLQTELASFIATNILPTGPTDLYYLVTPNGFGSCFNAGPTSCALGGSATGSFCGYHSAFGTLANPTIYANIPFNAVTGHCRSTNPRPNSSTADPTISTISHEHNEAITDPLPAGVGNSQTGWVDPGGQEIGDLCAGNFGPLLGGSSGTTAYDQVIGSGHYYIQEEWSNDDSGGSTDPNVGCKPNDEAATVDFTPPASPRPGVPAAFNGTANDTDGSIVSYSWDFGDGSGPGSGASPSHTYAAGGTFQVKLTITDITGQQASVTKLITLDEPPTSGFSVTTAHPAVGRATSFSGASSTDADGSVTSYSWNFGDGSAAGAGASPSHTYAAAGTYTVTLTVIDSSGLTASTSTPVVVDEPPTAAFVVKPKHPASGSPVVLDGSSSHDPDGPIASYSWSFGDGSQAGSGAAPRHSYKRPGTYTVTLTVTDGAGISSSATAPVKVSVAGKIVKISFKSTNHGGFLRVDVNGPGVVTAGKKTVDLAKAGRARFRIVVTAKGLAILQRDHLLKVKVKVKFVPVTGVPSLRTVTITFKK